MQTLLHITTVQPFLEKIKQIGLSQHFERWRAVQDSFMCVDGATGGGGGVFPQNALLSLTFSLPFLSPSSLWPQRAREWERTGKKTH